MLNSVTLKNYGPLQNLQWNNLGKINLIIGANGSGKTFLLKALYTAIRSSEAFQRGDERRDLSEILLDKLYWTFQPEKVGDLVTKGTEGGLSCRIVIDGKSLEYRFGKDTSKIIPFLDHSMAGRDANSIFLPAKEVLSLHKIILKSRDQDQSFGFDDTYVDLARVLEQSPQRGRNYEQFSKARKNLEEIIDGKVEYDEKSGRWLFKKGNSKFPIGVTAEGVKKIAILDTLLGNRYLSPGSVIFIDEPESALHPKAISQFLDIIAMLAETGIQCFLASHSYFVVKKLLLIAQEKNLSIPLLSNDDGNWRLANLRNGLPENSIIQESVSLYRQEVELALR